ncbi:MAG: hypothetical protein P8X74_10610 [Reinekea sp.]|jgi:hypothetical protein
MIYLVVFLSVLTIVGAFMWMQPSPRDRRLAKLRSDALMNGFRISSLKVNDTSEYGRVSKIMQIVTIYELPLLMTSQDDPAIFTVQRSDSESGAYLPDGWVWEERRNLNEEHYQKLTLLLEGLPSRISIITLHRDNVGLCWDEVDANVSYQELKDLLISAATIVGREVLR